jgi:UDP-GlcNAc:undecaprenyl-phosphate GlcNAc-1-phosphate transferase
MVAVGLADDILGLSAWAKFLFQIATASAAVLCSGITDGIGVALAVFWVVLLINAHNFIDGMDGLLCGCSAIEGLMLGACFFIAGYGVLGIVSLYLMAACLAFRIYNRYPAHVFAGDCGSEALGFALGMLSLPLFGKGIHIFTLAPLFIFAYPIVDLFSSILRRVLHGYSPFRADRAHLHHRIFAAGISHDECTSILTSLCAVSGVLGVLISSESLWLPAGILCPFVAWYLASVKKHVLFSHR